MKISLSSCFGCKYRKHVICLICSPKDERILSYTAINKTLLNYEKKVKIIHTMISVPRFQFLRSIRVQTIANYFFFFLTRTVMIITSRTVLATKKILFIQLRQGTKSPLSQLDTQKLVTFTIPFISDHISHLIRQRRQFSRHHVIILGREI